MVQQERTTLGPVSTGMHTTEMNSKESLKSIQLPSPNHVLIWCKTCKKHEVVETKTAHYCSKKCSNAYFKDYWKKRYQLRKVDPVARAHVRKAVQKYKAKLKAQNDN